MIKVIILLASLVCFTYGYPGSITKEEFDGLRELQRVHLPVRPGVLSLSGSNGQQYQGVLTGEEGFKRQRRSPQQTFKDRIQEQVILVNKQEPTIRHRRSPQQLGVQGMAYPGGAGSVRAQFDSPQWTSPNGRHSLEGNAYYQRNFNMPGPRQDWGAGARYTFRF